MTAQRFWGDWAWRRRQIAVSSFSGRVRTLERSTMSLRDLMPVLEARGTLGCLTGVEGAWGIVGSLVVVVVELGS